MRTGHTAIPSAWETPWAPLDTMRDGNVPGPVWKVLSREEGSGACTYLMHLPPNWHDDVLDWHPACEEAFVLSGRCTLGVEGEGGYTVLEPGSYCYRPPGILHGPARAPSVDGATIFQRMSGDLRILRYAGNDVPLRHLQPLDDVHATWPVPWNECLVTGELPWEASGGSWSGARHKWIWRNQETGGGCAVVELPAGWEGAGSVARGCVEEFVLEGDLYAGGQRFGLWGYAHRPAGEPAGSYSTEGGARLLCYFDMKDELDNSL